MANRLKLTDRAKEKFLEVVRATCNVSEAARAIGMARRSLYDARARDSEFAQLWDVAVEEASDRLEGEAWRRAVEGWDEPVFFQGKVVGAVRKYSDRMLELLLKGHRPEKYKDRHEVTGGPSPLQFVGYDGERLSKLSNDEIRALDTITKKLAAPASD